MRSLRGFRCVVCEGLIAGIGEGKICARCDKPIHYGCLQLGGARPPGHCSVCGANLSKEVVVVERVDSSAPLPTQLPPPPAGVEQFASIAREIRVAWFWIRLLFGAIVAGPVFLAVGIYTGSTYSIVLSSALIILIVFLGFTVWKRSVLRGGDGRREDAQEDERSLT